MQPCHGLAVAWLASSADREGAWCGVPVAFRASHGRPEPGMGQGPLVGGAVAVGGGVPVVGGGAGDWVVGPTVGPAVGAVSEGVGAAVGREVGQAVGVLEPVRVGAAGELGAVVFDRRGVARGFGGALVSPTAGWVALAAGGGCCRVE
jgi:hypothetical protein